MVPVPSGTVKSARTGASSNTMRERPRRGWRPVAGRSASVRHVLLERQMALLTTLSRGDPIPWDHPIRRFRKIVEG